MMNLQKLRNQHQPKLMIIPMIDIIFFLLIFFMISTLYMTEQKALPIQLPSAASSEVLPESIINITILTDEKLLVDQKETTHDKFPDYLLSLQIDKQAPPLFVIHADKQIPYGSIVFVLDELKTAGLNRVAFATSRRVD